MRSTAAPMPSRLLAAARRSRVAGAATAAARGRDVVVVGGGGTAVLRPSSSSTSSSPLLIPSCSSPLALRPRRASTAARAVPPPSPSSSAEPEPPSSSSSSSVPSSLTFGGGGGKGATTKTAAAGAAAAPAAADNADALVSRAAAALDAARAALQDARLRAPLSSARGLPGEKEGAPMPPSQPRSFEFSSGRSASSSSSAPPAAASSRSPPELQRATAQKKEANSRRLPSFAEPASGSLRMSSQASSDAASAAARESLDFLVLESALDLSSASAPPSRSFSKATAETTKTSTATMTEEAVAAASAATTTATMTKAAAALEDGSGVLADGTSYVRDSGEEKGPGGLWHRWTRVRGSSEKGEWSETWWETSDWAGRREMGAEKSGARADGAAWREAWKEVIGFDAATGEPTVERTAHKWARAGTFSDTSEQHVGDSEEWEEKWGEHYWGTSQRASKYAEKWAKGGPDCWHEKWGEEYDGGGGCVKYTDKWAERDVGFGALDKWGDKWEENFKDGTGFKKGEIWSSEGHSGKSFNRWWGEDHLGGGRVRKHGHSTEGESWDNVEEMDTYYNPIPHFTYEMALAHSPELRGLPVLPRGGEDDGADEGVAGL